MTVTRIFTGDDGRSHFEELSLPLRETDPPTTLAGSLPVGEAMFLETPAGTVIGRHNAPRRQLLINLRGVCELECVDGIRQFGPGDIRFADDRQGEGHLTRVLDDDVRVLVLPLPDDLDISAWRPT
jgi:hypothetical protein